MGKIYVLEAGSAFEGGGAVAVSTRFINVWKLARKLRIQSERLDRFEQSQAMRLVGKWHWSNDYDYLLIREFDDA